MTQTNPTTHTAASLAALPPRELDALAHGIVCPDKNTMWVSPTKFFYVDRSSSDWGAYPEYSRDLNHAALLEAELARRGLDERRAECLDGLVEEYVIDWRQNEDVPQVNYKALSNNQCAAAKSRTIAAILAVQGNGHE